MPCDRPHRAGHQVLDAARLDARAHIRSVLSTWCKTLEEAGQLTIPDQLTDPVPVRWMAHQVAVRVGWILSIRRHASVAAELAAREHAWGLLADLLGYQGEDGWHRGAWGHRHLLDTGTGPTGVRVQCPACESWVRITDDVEVIRCTGTLPDGSPCQEWGTIEHWRTLVASVDDGMTAPDLVDWLARHHRYTTTEATIWQWASRGTRHGKLTRIEATQPGEHLATCDRPDHCTGCRPGPARYDPIRAAELVMLLRGVGVRPRHGDVLAARQAHASSS